MSLESWPGASHRGTRCPMSPLHHSQGRSHPREVTLLKAHGYLEAPTLGLPSTKYYTGGSTTWCNGHHPLAVLLESLKMLSVFPKQGKPGFCIVIFIFLPQGPSHAVSCLYELPIWPQLGKCCAWPGIVVKPKAILRFALASQLFQAPVWTWGENWACSARVSATTSTTVLSCC